MSIFDRFESVVERGVNSAFSRVFKSGLKPVDITTALRRAMDDNISEMSPDRTIAPNHFTVGLSEDDAEKLHVDLAVLADELASSTTQYAEHQEYALIGPIEVVFDFTDDDEPGKLTIDARSKRGAVAPAIAVSPSAEHPILDVDGEKWLLTEQVTVVGRGSEAHIVVNDPGVSRQHLEFRITPTGVIATDLGSTNGSFVEGHRIDAATLVDGNEIRVGNTKIMFWTHPAPVSPKV